MKRFLNLLVMVAFAASLTACDNQGTAAVTDAVGGAVNAAGEQVADAAGGGIDLGDAALGAAGGMLLGSMLGGSSDRRQVNNYTTIVKQKNVYKASPSRPSTPYRSSSRSSFSSSRSFGGRR